MEKRLTFYHPTEEKLNVISHGLGLAMSIGALASLVIYATLYGTAWHVFSVTVYGLSLVVLYTASTLYHFVQEPGLRYKLNILDHAAIYVLIAGTYTPFTIHVLQGSIGWLLFGTVWTAAVIGITFKLFFAGRFQRSTTVAYVVMGWIAVFALEPFIRKFDPQGVVWVFAGGFAYTFGAVMYAMKSIRFNHAIFHVFVLFGSICHFVAVFFYLLPNH